MSLYFFFNDTATTEIYTLSLHDALPISGKVQGGGGGQAVSGIELLPVENFPEVRPGDDLAGMIVRRSEEHTSELQSRQYLVCRLLLEKKKTNTLAHIHVHAVISLTAHCA